MNSTLVAVIVALIVALVAIILVLRRSAKPGSVERTHLGDGAASALEDVADQFMGIHSHPDLAGPPDELTRLKGLGPKAAAQLNAFGITRYAQLAHLSDADIASVDAHMGAFRGRIARDRWVEQAALLATGRTAEFERTFGNLGSA
jgi:predicted flap endonuclease-1-like 5' DNA nuclease